MNLSLIGNYGATNVGDDAILQSLLKLFSSHQVTVFSAHPKQTAKQFKVPTAALFPLGIRSTLKFRFRKSLKTLKKCDAVVLGGGGLFQDDKLYACFLWAWQVFWVKRAKKPLFICATGVGPLRTKLGQKLTRWAYQQAQLITVRDKASKSLLLKLGLPEDKIHVTADPTFLMESSSVKKNLEKKQLFISLRPWLSYTTNVIQSMTQFLLPLKQQGWEFTFVAMQSIREEDQSFLKALIQLVGGKFLIPEDFSALLKQMNHADAAVGMRYHFLIAALLTSTPFVALSYSPKVTELASETPLEPYMIPVEKVSLDHLQVTFEALIQSYDVVQRNQAHRLKTFRQLAEKNQEQFEAFIKTIDPAGKE